LTVSTLSAPADVAGRTFARGTFFIRGSSAAQPILQRAAAETGVPITSAASPQAAQLSSVARPRIALWDRYGGSIRSGWTRFLFDQFGFTYDVVYPPDIDAGKLAGNYDVLVLPDDATIGRTPHQNEDRETVVRNVDKIPEPYRSRIGSMSIDRTLPKIREFLQAGGTVVAMGNASSIGVQLGLPLRDVLVDSTGRLVPRARFYVPGSVLRVALDTSSSIASGLPPAADVFYDNNPAFALLPGAEAAGVRRIAWFDSPKPLRSGWAWGQELLSGAVEALSAPVGRGRLILFGPDVQFRHQSQGTFKFLFNSIYMVPQ
jgi:hypothetical protein